MCIFFSEIDLIRFAEYICVKSKKKITVAIRKTNGRSK